MAERCGIHANVEIKLYCGPAAPGVGAGLIGLGCPQCGAAECCPACCDEAAEENGSERRFFDMQKYIVPLENRDG